MNFNQTFRIVPREVPYNFCTNHSTSVHKMVARATDIKKTTSNSISSRTPWPISAKLIGLFLWRSSTKIAQIVWLLCTKCQPELKTEKTSNNIISITTWRISTKLDRIVPWEILYRNCSNYSTSLHKVAARAKNRKKNIYVTAGQISTKLDWIVLWEVLYQNCSNCSALLNKIAFKYEYQVLHLKQMFSGE